MNRFEEKFNNKNQSNDVEVVEVDVQPIGIAESILTAGTTGLNIDNIQISEKPKKYSASYYMSETIHKKIINYAEANDLKPSAFLEEVLKQVFNVKE